MIFRGVPVTRRVVFTHKLSYLCKKFNIIDTVKIDIRKLSLEELTAFFVEKGLKAFRAKQVYQWMWAKAVTDFDEMTNLSLSLREDLEKHFIINNIILDTFQKSSDGTIKSRFKLHDGHLIESVLIPVEKDNRFTVCVSSQVGCSLSCKFCATGQMKIMRNLDPGEIYDQVAMVNQQTLEYFGHPITNIVYMGMGEPLLNYKNVVASIDHICNPKGLGMAPRRITVSTVGIAKKIYELADNPIRVNLAISLHAADDVKRSEIMPINDSNNLEVLLDALKYFYTKTKKRISYEYIAFEDFNDSIYDAKLLTRLCQDFPVIVNIIEYNPVDGLNFVKTEIERLNRFAKYLLNQKVMVTIRKSRGKDIDAACGQLANKG